ncbi:MAG TPA: hypothetical protein VGL42_17170 [Opitutaceae bacterium]|jgi:hypothetical protein
MLLAGIFALWVLFLVLAFVVLDHATRFSPPAVPAQLVVRPRVTIRNVASLPVRIRQSSLSILQLEPPSSLEVSLN